MSDDRRFQQMMTDHVDRGMQREWMQKYSPKAVQNFSRPARMCELCGTPMNVNPVDGRNYVMSEFERKWSVHNACKEEIVNRLDRESNMGSARQSPPK